ncbi:hypothetical protein BDU57DRAFT_454576, partial [Ampelomyces quisqualis]
MNEAFRFLDLPKELRLMVYNFLPIRTTHLRLEPNFDKDDVSWIPSSPNANHNDPHHSITFLHKSLDGVAVMRTCRVIASESSAILRPKLSAMRNAPTRVLVDASAI